MTFRKYMHVERLGNSEVEGIELGTCYVFPKLDGTNASVWLEDGEICAGNRSRKLSLENDNAGFLDWATKFGKLKSFLHYHPDITLYGEWLVPHSLKTYRNYAWGRFYVFDVYDNSKELYLNYDLYAPFLESYDIDIIMPLATVTNPSRDSFLHYLEKNTYLIEDGKGIGEGIVIKNYDFINRYGNVVWAKLVTNEFKEKNSAEFGVPVRENYMVEQDIVSRFLTTSMLDKIVAKIELNEGGWNSKYIPRLLGTAYHDLVTEELWAAIKHFKQPKIDFKILNRLTILKVKQLKPEIF